MFHVERQRMVVQCSSVGGMPEACKRCANGIAARQPTNGQPRRLTA